MPMREAWGPGQYGGRPVPMDVRHSSTLYIFSTFSRVVHSCCDWTNILVKM